MTILYILCGLPLSGKSLLSKKIEGTTSIKRVSFDDEWDRLKQINNQIIYETGLREIEDILRKNLKGGQSVVYDSINLSNTHRTKLKKLAEESGALSVIIYLKTSVQEIHRRWGQSLIDKSHHYLNKDFINKSIEHLEAPSDCIIISNEKEKNDFLESLILT